MKNIDKTADGKTIIKRSETIVHINFAHSIPNKNPAPQTIRSEELLSSAKCRYGLSRSFLQPAHSVCIGKNGGYKRQPAYRIKADLQIVFRCFGESIFDFQLRALDAKST